jgi:hypothetical protein
LKRIITLACAPVVIAGVALIATTVSAGAASQTAARHGGALPRITVTMNGKSIHVGGALQSGGVQIVSVVTKEQQGFPAFVRLDPGVTLGQFFAAFQRSAGDPNGLNGVGSLVVDAQANKGFSNVAANLAPGQYVALDTAGQNPAKWPFTTFTIGRAGSPATLPAPSATITAIDFGFRGPGTLHDGQLVRFANHGWLVHMVVAARGSSLAVANKIAGLLLAGKDNQAQGMADGFYSFAGPLSHGAAQQLTLNVQPGYWVIACFMNTQDGREHTQLGMERVVHITG